MFGRYSTHAGRNPGTGFFRQLLMLSLLAMLLTPVAVLAQPLSQGGTYVVQRGDTLNSIATRFGVSSSALARANGITNANFVWVGQRLTIPGNAAPVPTPVPGPAGSVYIVQPGDRLANIAARFGTTVQAIMAANGIKNADLIYTGQRLTVGSATQPTATPEPAPTATSAGPTGVPPTRAAPTATPTKAPKASPTPLPPPGGSPTTGRWIDVDVTHQRLTAYEGTTPVFTTLASTGLPGTPTVIGTYKIYIKLASTTMSGPGYYLPNVPYTMYFYGGYGIHGTYWHNNFGHPMSHGCVNLSTQDAAWVFGFASVGTTVITHR